jgi:hypothetical protein
MTVGVTSETTNSNSLLLSTASNDIQQHANSGDVATSGVLGQIGIWSLWHLSK